MIWPVPVTPNTFMCQECAFTGWAHRGATGAVKGREEKRGPRTVLWRILYMSPERFLVTSYSHSCSLALLSHLLLPPFSTSGGITIFSSYWTRASTPALCESSVRTRWDLILPEIFLVLEIAWGPRELWRTKIQFPPLPSHSNLRRCKFHVSWWWQIRGGRPDNTAAAAGTERQAD